MSEHQKDDEKDPDLAAWLKLWEPPGAPARLRERLRLSYRSGTAPAPLWKRVLRARVGLPVPLAALFVGILLALGVLAGRLSSPARPDRGDGQRSPAVEGGGLANLRPLPEVQLTVLRQKGDPDDPR